MANNTQPVTISVITSLYRCEKFLKNYLEHVSKITNLHACEFILVHNDPTEEEFAILNRYKNSTIRFVHYAVPREGLYTSWNRGVRAANGKYITIWNVDDVRFPDSINEQAKALDENPDAAIAYGDMYGSTVYGQAGDRLYNFPEWKYNRQEFYRSYLMSCFQMWRKSIHTAIGYYDEQFRCVGDFDFQVRTAMHFPMVKAPAPLGIYLEDQPHKISSSSSQVLENNIVYLRYGVFEKIHLHLLPQSLSLYKKNKFMFFREWLNNPEKSPFGFLYQAKGVFISAVKMPLYMMKLFINSYRR